MKEFLAGATPDAEQQRDTDFLLSLGEMFTLVVYGQLILENAKIYKVEEPLIDQIFDFMVRDFAKFALTLYGKASTTDKQMDYLLQMIKKPAVDHDRFRTILNEHVLALKDSYEMKS